MPVTVPGYAVWEGLVCDPVVTWSALTVSTAAFVVVVPAVFANTASYSLPFWEAATFDTMSVSDVAPESGVHVAPPFWEPRQRTAGVGGPDAAVVNVADWPALTLVFAGCAVTVGRLVTTGRGLTVSTAGLVVAAPLRFVNTASYSLPFCEALTLDATSVLDVAPGTGTHVVPPFWERRHCTVGVGVPDPAAVNVAVSPATSVTFDGSAATLARALGDLEVPRTSAATTPRIASAIAMIATARLGPLPVRFGGPAAASGGTGVGGCDV